MGEVSPTDPLRQGCHPPAGGVGAGERPGEKSRRIRRTADTLHPVRRTTLMAFVVVLFRGEELTRRELTGPLVIGRAPECDVSVRDILLSRRHCQISPAPDGPGWIIEDLGSKNGTRIGGEAV